MDISLFERLAENLLQAELCTLGEDDDCAAILAELEKRHCFSQEMQSLMTAEKLTHLVDDLPVNTFCETEDMLHISLMLFRFAGKAFLLGPYVKVPYNNLRTQLELTPRRVSHSTIQAFRLYYSAMPLLPTVTVVQVLSGICRALDPNCPNFETRCILDEETATDERIKSDYEKTQIEQIYQRYRIENRLLAAIREGDTPNALRLFDYITSFSMSRSHAATLYHSHEAAFSVLRTLMRKAAEEGGLSVVTIDTLTQRQAQISVAASTEAKQMRSIRDLLRDLTDAVHAARLMTENCSAETKTILEYLHLHYAEAVCIDDLVELTGYSRSHISARFKAEKGMSILQWIAMLRCRKARSLLQNTDASISDIAATVGYEDSNYFVKVFKKEFGLTPSAVRLSAYD